MLCPFFVVRTCDAHHRGRRGTGRGGMQMQDKEARDDVADVQMSPRAKSRRSPLRVAPRQVSTPADAALRAPPAPPGRPAPPGPRQHATATRKPSLRRLGVTALEISSPGRRAGPAEFALFFSAAEVSLFPLLVAPGGPVDVPAGLGPTGALGDPLARGGAPPTEIRGVVFRTRSHETAWDLTPCLACRRSWAKRPYPQPPWWLNGTQPAGGSRRVACRVPRRLTPVWQSQ